MVIFSSLDCCLSDVHTKMYLIINTMKPIIYVILSIFLIFSTSCTRKIAKASNVEPLHHGGQQVYPYYTVKSSPLGVASGCLAFTGLSYLGGYQLFKYHVDGVTPFSNEERHTGASIIAGAGLGLSAVVGGGFMIANRKRTQNVKDSDIEKWLKKYNKRNNLDLEYMYSRGQYVILAPSKNKVDFANAEIGRIKELENERKVKNAETWSTILGILGVAVMIGSENSKNNKSKDYKDNQNCTCNTSGGTGYSKVQDINGNADKCWNCKGKGQKCD